MSYKVEQYTIDGVISWYEKQSGCVNWCIYHKKPENVKYSYKNGDPDEALDHLHLCLQDIKNVPENTNDYFLICDKKAKTDKEKPVLIFRLNNYQSTVGSFPGQYQAQYQPTNEILSRLNAIEARLIDEEIDEDLEEQPQDTGSILAGILNKPEIQNVIVGALTGLVGNLITPKVTAVAGIKEDSLDDILNTLFSKGVKIDHLRKLAEMPEAKIQMLISML